MVSLRTEIEKAWLGGHALEGSQSNLLCRQCWVTLITGNIGKG